MVKAVHVIIPGEVSSDVNEVIRRAVAIAVHSTRNYPYPVFFSFDLAQNYAQHILEDASIACMYVEDSDIQFHDGQLLVDCDALLPSRFHSVYPSKWDLDGLMLNPIFDDALLDSKVPLVEQYFENAELERTETSA